MKVISLTQDKVALVDDEDYERLNQFKWYARWNNQRFYACRKIKTSNGQKIEHMHRVIAITPHGLDTDHKNGDSLDNQKDNLRWASRAQNMQNQKYPARNNKLGIKGVSLKCRKFEAKIKLNGKNIRLGLFTVLGDADSAYREAEDKHYGVFSRNSKLANAMPKKVLLQQ